MRLKQLLCGGLALPLFTTLALADSQLTNISVQNDRGAAVVTIHANGTFTHNEYRPADNLLLVDFPGAKVGALDSNPHPVTIPGISSYQVHSYKAANGSEVARVEFALAPHTNIRFSEQANALILRVSSEAEKAANVDATDSNQPAASIASATQSLAARAEAVQFRGEAQRVQVRGVSIVRGHDGTDVEIRATGPLNPKVLTLKSPDRLVIDLPNAVPETRTHNIPVHATDLNMVRMSQFQANPPTTRVVLDLKSPQGFALAKMNNKLIVSLHPLVAAEAVASTANSGVPKPAAASSTPKLAANVALQHAAQHYVVVDPEYHRVAHSSDDDVSTPAEKASAAAKILGAAPPVEIPLTSKTSAEMKPELMKAAMMQAAQSSSSSQAVSALASTTNCNTGRYTGEPISVNLKDVDLKDFFRLIHEISGLNVVLDPGVNGTLTIVLDDVPWDQALAIVLQNNSLQCQLNGNVLRIALPDTLRKEADAIRATQEAQALAVDRVTVTRYLSYGTAKNVVPTLKAFLSKRGDIIADDRTNSIIIQDIPSVIPGIDRLIKELDRKSQQVEIEARVVASTRSFARDLGTQVGFGVGNNVFAVGGNTSAGTSDIQAGGPQTPHYIIVGTNQIPLFSNLGVTGPTSALTVVNATNNYRLDVILTAAETRGLLKILSRPRVVTQNNAPALVRQGVRIPIVTAAQLGGPPTTTYIDAFLRLQVTPQITAENTIFLNVDVENTTPNFAVQISGNPELITQQATTQVLVSDGGTVVIGGVIQTTDSITRDQVPFLGDVPVLGNLFRRKAVSTSTQELIFFITPRILQS
ncbi:MAG TPA: type IV pilus secretin PilQ [Terriglobales bacterium]|nr:type IV pilus secretin PilQ [Terriglobales bacterium]